MDLAQFRYMMRVCKNTLVIPWATMFSSFSFLPLPEFTSLSGRKPDMGRDEEAARQRFPPFALISHPSVQKPSTLQLIYHFAHELVNDLKVRRNHPQCLNVVFKVRTSQNPRGSCRSRGGRCQGTHGNSSYIFSNEEYTGVIKYAQVWKWRRTLGAYFFDPNVRHQACLRSVCVEHSGQLPRV